MLAGAEEPRGRQGAGRLPAQRRGAGRAAGQHVRLPGRATDVTLPADWAKFAEQPTTPYAVDPADDRREPRGLADRVDATSPPGEPDEPHPAPAAHPRRRSPRSRCWCCASSSCCRSAGCSRRGSGRTAPSTPAASPRCWPGRGCTGCCGSRSGRPAVGTAAPVLLGLPAAYVLTGCGSPASGCCARAAAGAVRAADRRGRRRVPAAARRRRPARLPRPRRQPRRRSSRRWCSSTSPSWSAPSAPRGSRLDPRPGEAAAALGASPCQVFRTVTLPALRPRSSPRPAWSSCSAPPRSASC